MTSTTITIPATAGTRDAAQRIVSSISLPLGGIVILDFSRTMVAAPSFIDELILRCLLSGADSVAVDTHSQRIRDYALRSARLRGLGARVTLAADSPDVS